MPGLMMPVREHTGKVERSLAVSPDDVSRILMVLKIK